MTHSSNFEFRLRRKRSFVFFLKWRHSVASTSFYYKTQKGIKNMTTYDIMTATNQETQEYTNIHLLKYWAIFLSIGMFLAILL